MTQSLSNVLLLNINLYEVLGSSIGSGTSWFGLKYHLCHLTAM